MSWDENQNQNRHVKNLLRIYSLLSVVLAQPQKGANATSTATMYKE